MRNIVYSESADMVAYSPVTKELKYEIQIFLEDHRKYNLPP